ncbi:MAG: ABC transporter ATP-binding protein [Lachnospiraceae bacterium]|nr:ABC transporter ATP-binding protein [Lachnospiraceae bacterium]
MAILEIKDVVKTYGRNRGKIWAVNHIDLRVKKGSFTTIIGRSGSGKSTLLEICSGLMAPEQGSVKIDGVEITNLNHRKCSELRRQKTGFVFQDFRLIDEFTVLENICVPLYLDRREPDMQYIEMLLQAMSIRNLANAMPDELSGGEQQRVAIARALAARPAIVFADEPTGNLDLKTGEEIMNLLDYCNYQLGQTILLVSHDLELIQDSHRIIHMEDGKIIEDMEAE